MLRYASFLPGFRRGRPVAAYGKVRLIMGTDLKSVPARALPETAPAKAGGLLTKPFQIEGFSNFLRDRHE
jgi:hypothetical protein